MCANTVAASFIIVNKRSLLQKYFYWMYYITAQIIILAHSGKMFGAPDLESPYFSVLRAFMTYETRYGVI